MQALTSEHYPSSLFIDIGETGIIQVHSINYCVKYITTHIVTSIIITPIHTTTHFNCLFELEYLLPAYFLIVQFIILMCCSALITLEPITNQTIHRTHCHNEPKKTLQFGRIKLIINFGTLAVSLTLHSRLLY